MFLNFDRCQRTVVQNHTISVAKRLSRYQIDGTRDTRRRVDTSLAIDAPVRRMAGIVRMIEQGDAGAHITSVHGHEQIDPGGGLLFGVVVVQPSRTDNVC